MQIDLMTSDDSMDDNSGSEEVHHHQKRMCFTFPVPLSKARIDELLFKYKKENTTLEEDV